MKVKVDVSKCVGLGICESAAPSHFEVGDDAQVIVVRDLVLGDDLASVEEAVRGCPTGALRLTE